MINELSTKNIMQINKLYASGYLTPIDVVDNTLARLVEIDIACFAFCFWDPDNSLKAAYESTKRWSNREPKSLLDGIPYSCKDLILTKGWPTLRGSLLIDKDQVWDEDAPCVQRLNENGAILIGKTTTPEFGWKALTDSHLTGVTLNPWCLERTPGGSSGGAAVAAALRIGLMHLGTDGGGSIRIPAAYCGVFGFKASAGRIPLYPPSPFGSLAHVGPISTSVSDAAAMLEIISKPDNRDIFSLPYQQLDYIYSLNSGVNGLRIAYSPDLGYASVDLCVARKVEEAVEVFKSLGARVEIVNPAFSNPQEIFRKHWYVGAASLLRNFTNKQKLLIEPGLCQVSKIGEKITLTDFLEASNARAELTSSMRSFHEKYDLLITPTMPTTALMHKNDHRIISGGCNWDDLSPFTYPFNLTGQPAASIPCGLADDGLPVSMQIIGNNFDDLKVISAAAAYEKACPNEAILHCEKVIN